MQQISVFKIGKELFGVNILLVKELCKIQEITKVPGASNNFHGLMNLRGHVLSIIKPNLFLDDYDLNESSEVKKVLIFKIDEQIKSMQELGILENVSLGNDYVGLIINYLEDVIEVNEKDILPPLTSHFNPKLLEVAQGIIQLKNNIVMILDLGKLLEMFLKISKPS